METAIVLCTRDLRSFSAREAANLAPATDTTPAPGRLVEVKTEAFARHCGQTPSGYKGRVGRAP